MRRALPALLLTLMFAPAAHAADPIMPLSQVHAGLDCVGLSVIRGVQISQFDVEIIDVVGGQTGLGGPRILVRASGPAVDATGIAEGFSGSPVLCLDPNGVRRNIGAISQSVGEYGNHVVLVTPIEEMLGDAPAAPAGAATAAGARVLRSARPLAGTLTVSGLSPRTRGLLDRAARRAGRHVLAAPVGPINGFPAQPLVPGASVAAMLSTGDIGVGAVGTVTYRDGPRIWAFGHPLDALGQRTLFLEDAYVFGVIANPLGIPDLGADSYKLTSAGGHTQGTLTADSLNSISGGLGAAPASIPLQVTARERGGRSVTLNAKLADERRLGYGANLSLVAPLGASEGLDSVIRNYGPVTMSMCFRVKLKARKKPIGFCNAYFDGFSPLDDITNAAGMVDGYDVPPPAIDNASVSIRARRGVDADVLLHASLPKRARRGERVTARLSVGRRGDGRRRLSFPMRIPRNMPLGPQDHRPERGERRELRRGPAAGVRRGPRRRERRGRRRAALDRAAGLRPIRPAPGPRHRGPLPPGEPEARLPVQRRELRGAREGQSACPPGAPLTAASSEDSSPSGCPDTFSNDVERMPSEATSSLKSWGWLAALSASSMETRPAW